MLAFKKSSSSRRSGVTGKPQLKGLRLPQEQKLNLKTYEKIRQQAQRDASAWPPGQYVGVFQGKVLAISPTFEIVEGELSRAATDRLHGMIFRIGDDYSKPIKTL